MVSLWEQEILGYHFTIVHRSNNIIVDVYALALRFVHIISHHIVIAALLRSHDQAKRPHAYAATKFSNLGNIKITETNNPFSDPPPFLTSNVLHRFNQYIITNSPTSPSLEPY